MAGKRKAEAKKKSPSKRLVTEIAPGVRTMLDAYLKAYNEAPDRVSPILKYTDVINQALDGFLPGKPEPEEPVASESSPAEVDSDPEESNP
jgi:hypothetical protein